MRIYSLTPGKRYFATAKVSLPYGGGSADLPLTVAFDPILRKDIEAGRAFITLSDQDKSELSRILAYGERGGKQAAEVKKETKGDKEAARKQKKLTEARERAKQADERRALREKRLRELLPGSKMAENDEVTETDTDIREGDIDGKGAPTSLAALNKLNRGAAKRPAGLPPNIPFTPSAAGAPL